MPSWKYSHSAQLSWGLGWAWQFSWPPPRIMWTILNLGKHWDLTTPPLGPNLGKNWNVDYFEIFVPPLILAKTGPKLFDPCKNSTKSYLTVTMGLFPSNISHICTKFCLYLTFISPMNYQIPDHISVIWIWEKCENPDPPPFGLFPQIRDISNLDNSPYLLCAALIWFEEKIKF